MRRATPTWVLPLTAAALAAAVFLLVKDSLTDDAYITLAYAKNLAVHGEWALTPGMPSNSATSPLNVLLLGALTAATRLFGTGPHPVVALGVLSVVSAAVLGWGWARLAAALRFPSAVALLGVVLVLVNPFVLSAIGLEVLLIPTLLLLLTVFAVQRRPLLYGAVSGLALLTRLDLIVFVVLVALCTPAIRRVLLRPALVAIAVAGPWYLFSWIVFGSAVPDTLVIKQAQADLFGPWRFYSGPAMYYLGRSIVVVLSFGPAVIGALAWFVLVGLRLFRRRPDFPPTGALAGLGAGGIAHYLVYSLLDVGPYHWYYVTAITSLGMFAVATLGVWLARSRRSEKGALAALGLVVVLVLGVAAVDLKQGLPWRSPAIFGNWASARDYARVGRQLGEQVGDATVRSPGEIGTLAYYCECSIVDPFSDRGYVPDLLRQRIDEAGPVTSALLRLNYLWFDHSREPRPLDYRLLYERTPGSGPNTWQVHSAARGVGHFTLVPVEDGR